MKPVLQFLYLCALLALVAASAAKAQKPQKPTTGPSTTMPTPSVIRNGAIDVRVFPVSGAIFTSKPTVMVTEGGFDGSPSMGVPEEIGENEWRFEGLQAGSGYEVVVEAKGYETQRQYVILAAGSSATARVNVYLVPNGRPEDTFARPPGHFLLSPRAQHEVDEAIRDLKSSKTAPARKHLETALKMAPSHPGVNYLMGLSYLKDHDTDKAVPYLEKSLSIDPSELQPRLALASVRYQQGRYSEAIDLLKDAVASGTGAWEAQWVLAACYLHMKNYEEARRHAEESLKADKKKASGVRLVLGEALAGLGRRPEAIKELQRFVKENSHDPEKARVLAMMEELRKPAPPSPEPAVASSQPAPASNPAKSTGTNDGATKFRAGAKFPSRTVPPVVKPVAAPAPPPAVPRNEDWAPPDVDAIKPPIISSRACSLSALLKHAGRTTVSWVKDLQEFTATEEYQSVEIRRHGQVEKPFEKKFEYLVFINKPRPNTISVEEMRKPEPNLAAMGAPVVALGSPALALVFHPLFAHDYVWSCDGLGEWKGKPAWIVRFTQRTDRPTTSLQSFEQPDGSSLLPLKGMAWLSEKGDHVMHLETELVNPMPEVRLERQHFSIDYGEVAFRSHPVKLWLPESVDLYIKYRGHSYHNYARYSHFLLFWTGTEQVIGSVKQNNPQR
jgi:tetratricopeptide (TPR) repeat protein